MGIKRSLPVGCGYLFQRVLSEFVCGGFQRFAGEARPGILSQAAWRLPPAPCRKRGAETETSFGTGVLSQRLLVEFTVKFFRVACRS
jgi:hypothetical protein